ALGLDVVADLCAQLVRVAGDAIERGGEEQLADAVLPVGVGGVEERDAEVQGAADERVSLVVGQPAVPRGAEDPAAKTDRGDEDPRSAQRALLHWPDSRGRR